MKMCECGSRDLERERLTSSGVWLVACSDCGRQWEYKSGHKPRVLHDPKELGTMDEDQVAEFTTCLEMTY